MVNERSSLGSTQAGMVGTVVRCWGGRAAEWVVVSDAVAVGLITSVSTLVAVGLTGVTSVWVSRGQLRHQAMVTALEHGEQRAARRREVRREVYVLFLARADEVYRRLDQRWADPPPQQPEAARQDQAYPALRRLDEAHNRVLLEGPAQVAEQAEFVVNSIGEEYREQRRVLRAYAGVEQGAAPLEPARHSAAVAARVRHRDEFTRTARQAIDDDHPAVS